MPLRTRLIIIFSAVVLVVLAISLFLIIGPKIQEKITKPAETPSEEQPLQTSTQSPFFDNNGSLNGENEIKPLTTEEMEKNAALQMAKIFAERFGSYSTDNSFQNIKDVLPLATPFFQTRLNAMIKGEGSNGEFVGVTSKVFSADLIDWTSESAEINLNVSRTENRDGETKKYYQEANVELKKQGDDWLVNDFSWK